MGPIPRSLLRLGWGRSLLAGDAKHPRPDPAQNRLQAGSYKGEKKQRASCVGVGLVQCPGACSGDLYSIPIFAAGLTGEASGQDFTLDTLALEPGCRRNVSAKF